MIPSPLTDNRATTIPEPDTPASQTEAEQIATRYLITPNQWLGIVVSKFFILGVVITLIHYG